MPTKLTTDWHLGVHRGAGTTPTSAAALRDNLKLRFAAELSDCDHLVCGDLLNDFTVDTTELIGVYEIIANWLSAYGKKLCLLRGNHDYQPRGDKSSSFDLLGRILQGQFPDQVTVANSVTTWKQFTLVPHLANQDLLTLELSRLADVKDRVIVFHCNIDNRFVADSQHSLGLASEQLKPLVDHGNLIVVGHEHQGRKLLGGRLLVLGNSAPSSIADCLGNDFKYSATVKGTEYSLEPIWDALGSYTEVDWEKLHEPIASTIQFIRITGTATAAQASDVISAIARYRASSSALVISNAVVVEGVAGMDELANASLQQVKSFDVFMALLELLEPAEQKAVKELLEEV